MKQGFTTGSCASAAARGAVHMLLTGEIAEKMTIMTPAGIECDRGSGVLRGKKDIGG